MTIYVLKWYLIQIRKRMLYTITISGKSNNPPTIIVFIINFRETFNICNMSIINNIEKTFTES